MDTTTLIYLARLSYCLQRNFPAPVTELLLLLAYDDDTTLADVYAEWHLMGDEFALTVRDITGEAVAFCDHCSEVGWHEDSTFTLTEDRVCDGCRAGRYTACDVCDEYEDDDEITSCEGNDYCRSCRDDRLYWCDDCDVWYLHEDHNHEPDWDDEDENGCDCTAWHRWFYFPANGDGLVANDVALNVELPAGIIDDRGRDAIYTLLHQQLVNEDGDRLLPAGCILQAMNNIGDEWNGQKGNYTRRLSRELYSAWKVKIPPTVLTEVGNLARQHSDDTTKWTVEFTRDLNLPAREFAHDESCWWTSYYRSRCALKNWGGLGIRSFLPPEHGRLVNGRAWILPLNTEFQPTHDTVGAHTYMVFNCYGALDGAKAARIVAHLTGGTYRKVGFEWDADNTYINNSSGWLVGPEETLAKAGAVTIGLQVHDNTDAADVNSTIIDPTKEVVAA